MWITSRRRGAWGCGLATGAACTNPYAEYAAATLSAHALIGFQFSASALFFGGLAYRPRPLQTLYELTASLNRGAHPVDQLAVLSVIVYILPRFGRPALSAWRDRSFVSFHTRRLYFADAGFKSRAS
jgi:hypothetical protein